MTRVHRDLLDMGVAINCVDEQVGHRAVVLVGEDPGSFGLLERGQVLDGRRLVIGDRVHTEFTELSTSRSLHVSQDG